MAFSAIQEIGQLTARHWWADGTRVTDSTRQQNRQVLYRL